MTGWVIDVCRTCGRHATWPFCEHRDEPQADGKPWCEPVQVRPATARGRELSELRSTSPREPYMPPGIRREMDALEDEAGGITWA